MKNPSHYRKNPPPSPKVKRECLRCLKEFLSMGSANRLCFSCNAANLMVGRLMAGRSDCGQRVVRKEIGHA